MATSTKGRPTAIYVDDLDCLVCGRWFRSFETLAAHTVRHRRRVGARQVARRINTYLAKWRIAAMKFPKPAPAQEATTFREFLKVKHIGGKVGGRAKLTVAGKPTI